MRKCLVFVISALLAFVGGGLALLKSGVIPFRANATPSVHEAKLATMALNASVAHHAPREANPYPPTEENLLRGLNIYRVGCSECHGVPGQKDVYGAAFYPPVPQFPVRPPQRSEDEIHYIVKYGIRNTGMAAWGNMMNDEQIWKVAGFLRHINELPPSVSREWNKP